MTDAAIATRVRRARPEPASRTVERRRADGSSLGRVALAPEFFGIEPNAAVLHQVVTAQLAAARSGTQSTRTRAEVAGGGAKPYKQKGTGRARQGTTRAPQWSGGGVALGPKPRSYRQRTPKKMIRLALCSALSDRAAGERVALVDAWGFEAPRTKDAVAALGALGISGKALVVLDPGDLDAAYSFRNLPGVHIISAAELNAYDVLRHDWVVFTDATVPGGVGATLPSDAGASAAPGPGPTSGPEPTPSPARTSSPARKAAAAKKSSLSATPAGADAEPGAKPAAKPAATSDANAEDER